MIYGYEPACISLAIALSLPVATQAADYTGALDHEDRRRSYLLHIPDSLPPGKRPLVLVLHGGGGNAANASGMSGMNVVADREGFLVVYPNGSGRFKRTLLTWNAGNCCGYALDRQIADVGFIRALIERLPLQYAIDTRRVYVSGMSNGGMLTYRLGCELSDRIAAIAVIAGAMNKTCTPGTVLPVLAVHGTADEHVRYSGGKPIRNVDRRHDRTDRAVMDTMDFWVRHNGCTRHSRQVDDASLSIDEWTECNGGAEVVLYTLKGFGHAWPGGQRGWRRGDDPDSVIQASEVIWAFFKHHSRP